jgi:hypothetical protein
VNNTFLRLIKNYEVELRGPSEGKREGVVRERGIDGVSKGAKI